MRGLLKGNFALRIMNLLFGGDLRRRMNLLAAGKGRHQRRKFRRRVLESLEETVNER